MKKETRIYDYDVYFTHNEPMVMAVSATSAQQAKLTALRILDKMTKEEIIDRFMYALDVNPDFKTHGAFVIEECTDCFSDEEKESLIKAEKEQNINYK